MLSSATKFRLLGLLAAGAALLWDQVTKLLVLRLFQDDPTRHIEVAQAGPAGLDLVLWWNRGISFGLLHLPSQYMPLILSGSALVVCAILAIWLWRVAANAQALALGLIIGGALGNVIDRFAYGAVVDFIYAYWGEAYWPAFNIADSCICIGVFLLIFSGGFGGDTLGKPAKTA